MPVPVFTSGKGKAPAWCEMRFFDILTLAPGDERTFTPKEDKEKWIVVEGGCEAVIGGRDPLVVKAGGQWDVVRRDGALWVRVPKHETESVTVVRMCGAWGEETGGSGLFGVVNSEDPKDIGDPVDYPKKTNFDNHYHDCDEYWIIVKGRGVAVSEGKRYVVGPGDCVATGMGHHHDFPEVFEPVKAVFFETTLQGQKRLGHLWEHTHGPARPDPSRV